MSGWETLPLGDVLVEAKPGFACGEDPSDGVFQFRMNNVTIEGQLDLSRKRRVPKDTRNLDSYLVKPGDVLFNATNSPELVGKSAFFAGYEEPSVFSNHFLRLRPSAEKVDGRFLARWLALQFQRKVFQGMCRQWVNQATVGRESLLALRIPVPPLAEQRRLAAILDQAQALRTKRRAALGQLDTLIQSIFVALVGDPWTNPNKVKIATLSDVTARITDGTHLTPQFIDCGVPFIFVKNIENGEIDFRTDKFIREDEHEALYRRCPIEPGDILYTIVGATYGQAAPVGTFTKFAFQRHIAHLKPDPSKILPDFLSVVMRLPFVKTQADRWARGAAQPTINLKELREFEILLPSLKLQQNFAQRAAAVQKLKFSYRTSLRQMDVLFASLQHRAFRGEL